MSITLISVHFPINPVINFHNPHLPSIQNIIFLSRQRVFSIQTTCLFNPDNVFFRSRQRVFSIQTTCLFHPDNASFWSRQTLCSIQKATLHFLQDNPPYFIRHHFLFYMQTRPLLITSLPKFQDNPPYFMRQYFLSYKIIFPS